MKILVLTDRYAPEIAAPSFRIADHAKVWLDHGHEVTVVTCVPNFPRGEVFPGYQNRLYQEEWIDGVRVIRLWSYMTANEGLWKRTLDYVSFMLSAILLCWRFPKFDVLLATSPPLFTAAAGWIVALLRQRPWVFEIRDLWPASIKAVGASRSRVLDWFEKLELFLYRRAGRIIALTHSFHDDLVSRGIPSAKIDVITNAVDPEQFNPSRATIDARQRLGISPDTFLAGYVGTTGMAHGLTTVVDTAHRCRNRPHLKFLIMGEGASRPELEARARELQLTNLHFADFVPHDEVPSYYAALDLSIVHLKPDPLFKTVIPSKMFEFMAMGTPLLMAVEGEGARIATEAGCGACIPSGDVDAMEQAITDLAEDRSALAQMGQRGREAVATRYNRRTHAAAALDSLAAASATYYGEAPHDGTNETEAADRSDRRQRVHRDAPGAAPARRAA